MTKEKEMDIIDMQNREGVRELFEGTGEGSENSYQEASRRIMGEPEIQENLDSQEESVMLQKIEATLFLAARFLDLNELVKFTGVNPLSIQESMHKLLEKYSEIGSALVIHAREVDGKMLYKMDVKKEFYSLVNKIVTGQTEFTKAEQETLAIIAYKQPIKQSSIVKIRGNKAYDHIHHFIEMGLVKAKKASRTFELTLSEEFYNYFNLKERPKN